MVRNKLSRKGWNFKKGESLIIPTHRVVAQGIVTVKGEVLRVEGDNYLVQRYDGKEVSLHVDPATQMNGLIDRGDRIEAKVTDVNDKKHVLSIRQLDK